MMRESPHPRVELEIATVRSTRRPVPQAIEDVLRRVDEAEARLRGAGITGGTAPAPPVQQSILDAPPPLARATGPIAGPGGRAGRPDRPRGPAGESGRGYSAPQGAAPPGGGPRSGVEPTVAPKPTGRPPQSTLEGAPDPGPATSHSGGSAAESAPQGLSQAPADSASPAGPDDPAAMGQTGDGTGQSAPGRPSDLADAWQRVVEEVSGKRALLGAVLAQVRPAGIDRGALTLVLAGNHFHRDRLLEPVAQDVLGQAVRRWVTGAERFTIAMEGEMDASALAHPAVQAAMTEFQGEIVAVRARSPEGGGA